MAKDKTKDEAVKTSYRVLRFVPAEGETMPDDSWVEVGDFLAYSGASARRAAMEADYVKGRTSGTYVAVPTRSFTKETYAVESKPHVVVK